MLTYFNNLTNYFDNNSIILKLTYSLYSRFRGNIHYYLPYGEFSATKITDNLYIGDIHSAYQDVHLKKEGITHIVNCVMGSTPGYPDDYKYLIVNVIDNENQNLIDKFETAVNFIDKAIQENGKVLIHCVCGVSRSVSITAAYLIYKNKISAEKAIEIIKEKRDVACPNPSFMEQLKIFYKNHGTI